MFLYRVFILGICNSEIAHFHYCNDFISYVTVLKSFKVCVQLQITIIYRQNSRFFK